MSLNKELGQDEKMMRQKFEVTIGLRKGHDLSGRSLIRAKTFFSETQPCHTSKEAEFYLDFKNINFP
jgi:hypothetical protein